MNKNNIFYLFSIVAMFGAAFSHTTGDLITMGCIAIATGTMAAIFTKLDAKVIRNSDEINNEVSRLKMENDKLQSRVLSLEARWAQAGLRT